MRIALQADATSLASGRYDYSIKLTADMGGILVVLWVRDNGDVLWIAEEGSGGFLPAAGDLTISTLVENVDDTFTVTDKHGVALNFDSSGRLTSRVDRNGNSVTYTYNSGLLTSVTDFAERIATLTFDASGRLTKITQPDPDSAGPLTAPVTSYFYDDFNRLRSIIDPVGTTVISYDDAGNLLTLKDPVNNTTTWTYDALGRLTTEEWHTPRRPIEPLALDLVQKNLSSWAANRRTMR